MLLVVLASCGGERDPKPGPLPPLVEMPGVLTATTSPGATVPLCARGTHPRGASCRADGFADLDGDGALDCWRVASGQDDAAVLWPGCAGDPIAFDSAGETVTLPEAQRTRAWAQAIATAMVGADHVGCEVPDATCGPLPPVFAAEAVERAARAWNDERAGTSTALPIAWTAGEPTYPAASAGVRADGSITVWRPDFEVPAAERHLRRVAACGSFEVWTGGGVLAARDLQLARWTILGAHAGDDARCVDSLLVRPAGFGVDSAGAAVLDLATARYASFGIDGGSWLDLFDDGYLPTVFYGKLSVAHLHGLLEPTAPEGPCAFPSPRPALLDFTPTGPCVASGRAKIDRGGTEDCWEARYAGTSAGGLVWSLVVTPSCKRATRAPRVELLKLETVLVSDETELDDAAMRWIGELLTGAPTACIPARKGCPRASAAMTWLDDRMKTYARSDGVSTPVWQAGTPTAPPVAAVRSDIPGNSSEGFLAVLLYTATLDAPLTEQPSCDRWQVWAGAPGGAVVDRATGKWTWTYLASTGDVMHQNDLVAPVTRGWCEGELAFYAQASSTVVTDPAHGTWAILSAAEWAWVKDRADKLTVLQAKLDAAARAVEYPLPPP